MSSEAAWTFDGSGGSEPVGAGPHTGPRQPVTPGGTTVEGTASSTTSRVEYRI
jgi:hypothetical protein